MRDSFSDKGYTVIDKSDLLEELKRSKVRQFCGHGVNKMLEVCKREHLSNSNSVLLVQDPTDLNSFWKVVAFREGDKR